MQHSATPHHTATGRSWADRAFPEKPNGRYLRVTGEVADGRSVILHPAPLGAGGPEHWVAFLDRRVPEGQWKRDTAFRNLAVITNGRMKVAANSIGEFQRLRFITMCGLMGIQLVMSTEACEPAKSMPFDVENPEPELPRVPFVYVLQVTMPDGRPGPVKVGYTTDTGLRFRHFESWCPLPLRLVATFPGTLHDERALLARFAPYAIQGKGREWLHPAAPVVEWLKGLQTDANA